MEKYYKYKHIFSGAYTPEDVNFLRDKCPEDDHNIIDCIIRTQKYLNTTGLITEVIHDNNKNEHDVTHNISVIPKNNTENKCVDIYMKGPYQNENAPQNITFDGCICDDTADYMQQKCDNKIGCIKMLEIIKKMNKLKYREDCIQYLIDVINGKMEDSDKIKYKGNCEKFLIFVMNKKVNKHQKNILFKIISKKPHDESYIGIMYIEGICPHCQKKNKAPFGTEYIVCGVDPEGLLPINDNDGSCLNDWCFDCGKKLCKNWDRDNLYDERNRMHDQLCCKKHAKINHFNYPLDYCQCEANRK
jgi:hypothetical protein